MPVGIIGPLVTARGAKSRHMIAGWGIGETNIAISRIGKADPVPGEIPNIRTNGSAPEVALEIEGGMEHVGGVAMPPGRTVREGGTGLDLKGKGNSRSRSEGASSKHRAGIHAKIYQPSPIGSKSARNAIGGRGKTRQVAEVHFGAAINKHRARRIIGNVDPTSANHIAGQGHLGRKLQRRCVILERALALAGSTKDGAQEQQIIKCKSHRINKVQVDHRRCCGNAIGEKRRCFHLERSP